MQQQQQPKEPRKWQGTAEERTAEGGVAERNVSVKTRKSSFLCFQFLSTTQLHTPEHKPFSFTRNTHA